MFRFFSKMRYRLAAENKVGRYLRYAVGEIILVVIGILIALQVNNWNSERLGSIEELNILEGLKNEFEQNLQSINDDLELNIRTSDACRKLTELIRSNELNNNPDLVDSLIYIVSDFGSFDAKTGFTDEITNSGKLNLIRNDRLKLNLTSFTGVLADAKEDYEFRANHYSFVLVPYLINIFPLSNGELYKNLKRISNRESLNKTPKSPYSASFNLIDRMKFENMIWTHKTNQDYIILNDYNIRDLIQETINIINSELKSHNL